MRNLCVAVLAVGALGLGGCAFQGGVNPNHFKYESRVYDGPIRGRALIEMPKAVQDEKFIGKPTSLTGAATNLTLQIGEITREAAHPGRKGRPAGDRCARVPWAVVE